MSAYVKAIVALQGNPCPHGFSAAVYCGQCVQPMVEAIEAEQKRERDLADAEARLAEAEARAAAAEEYADAVAHTMDTEPQRKQLSILTKLRRWFERPQ